MGLPPNSREVYMTWLMCGESYEMVAQHYGVSRETVYKRVKTVEAKMEAGCNCETWRCSCGKSPGRTARRG